MDEWTLSTDGCGCLVDTAGVHHPQARELNELAVTAADGTMSTTTDDGSTEVNLASLVEEFLAVMDAADFWVQTLGIAIEADNALDERPPDDPSPLPDVVRRLMASEQWNEWMYLRDKGGVALSACACGHPLPGTSACGNTSCAG